MRSFYRLGPHGVYLACEGISPQRGKVTNCSKLRPRQWQKKSKKTVPKRIWSWTYCPLSSIHHHNKPASVSDTLREIAVAEIIKYISVTDHLYLIGGLIKSFLKGEAKGAI